jgi:hypothetical protein
MTTDDAMRQLVSASKALINIVEGIDGAMTHGTWRAEKSNLRIKDTDEWVAFYVLANVAARVISRASATEQNKTET